MGTYQQQDKLRNKALMYVFGKRFGSSIVKVYEDPHNYIVIHEIDEREPGRYEAQLYEKGADGIDKEINDALAQLNWIAAGNEFPT